ncbi:MAG: FAD-dependent oxidoreductase [Anaerolineaceae bacterium]
MKVVIVGGVAGGASTAARLRRVDESAEIIMFEKGPYLSFANCGLPYHIGGVIQDRDQLLVVTPGTLRDMLRVEARTNSEVLSIDRQNKTVAVKELTTGRVYQESYDKLVLATGAVPLVPPLPGVDLPGVFVLHNIPEMDAIERFLTEASPKRVVVVGGGFIGLEIAENLEDKGLQVSVVEMLNQVMAPVDFELAAMVHHHLAFHKVGLVLGDGLKSIEMAEENGGLRVNLSSGKSLPTDMVVLAIGVRPETSLAKAAGLGLGVRGTIATNDQMQTSDADIYAVGDAVQLTHNILNQATFLALAGPASREGRTAADAIAGRPTKFPGVQGTSVVKVFDLTVASTGLNQRQLEQAALPFESVIIHANSHASYYPGAAQMALKLLFSPQDGSIYGAQAVGPDGVEKRIDVIATAIKGKLSVYDLEELELCYAPPFGSSRDPVNIAGFAAGNILRGDAPVKHWNDVDSLDRSEWFILDARLPEEGTLGSIPDSHLIPMQQLRQRLGELPRDRKILVYCASGQRSYFAARVLRQSGFDAYNLSGGYKTYAYAVSPQSNTPEPETKKMTLPSITANTQAPSASEYQLDACGLQCPGPILKLYNKVKEMEEGDVVTVKATDYGFANDVGAWTQTTGNTLLSLENSGGVITARVQKGLTAEATEASSALSNTGAQNGSQKGLTMVVFSGDLDKAIAAFIIANGFASMGQQATLFFTFWGLNLLRKDNPPAVKKNLIERMFGWMMPRGANKTILSQMHLLGMGTGMIKSIMKQKNIDSLPQLIQTAQQNGVKLLACQMTMDLMGIKREELLDDVEIAGVATMAADATTTNTHFFI